MKRITLKYTVIILSMIMMVTSLVAIMIAPTNDLMLFSMWSFLGWSSLGCILITTIKN
jgi:hypothetical protein